MPIANATVIVHWPGKDTAACDDHARRLQNLALHIGLPNLSSTPATEVVQCQNCVNEEAKRGKN